MKVEDVYCCICGKQLVKNGYITGRAGYIQGRKRGADYCHACHKKENYRLAPTCPKCKKKIVNRANAVKFVGKYYHAGCVNK